MRKDGRHIAARAAQDKGFYIILVLCVAAIVISGYVLFFAPLTNGASMDGVEYTPDLPKQETAWTPTAGDAETEDQTVVDTVLPEATEPVIESTEPVEPVEEEVPAEPEEPAEESQETAAPVWVKPLDGEVVQAFSGDELVYQETFGDWRVHTGADYAASAGDRVYAVADGTVTEVTEDALWGTCITLQLSDGRTAVYRGLAEDPKVKKDSSVKAGDVLGTLASVVPAETDQGAHVHLEILDADGLPTDPEQAAG